MKMDRDGAVGVCLRGPAVLCALSLALIACGTPPDTRAPGATASASVASEPTATTASPRSTATATPLGTLASSPVSMGMAASRAPIFYYQARMYWQVGFGRAGAAASLQPGQPVGTTFSRWQSNGLVPAGTTIYSVADQPVERMLAVPTSMGMAFFQAEDRPSGLDSVQVVQGTVISFGPGRWTTPNGKAPSPGQKPADREFSHAFIYTPATVKVERTLQGLIPTGREIEVRQWGGTAGAVTTTISTGGVTPLVPGSTVILFLTPGQWSSGGPGNMPPGDYYLLWPERAYAVANGQVTPLGVPDASSDVVPLERFEAGLAETFTGVTPLDPHGPKPTPPPTPIPAPTPTPRFTVGQRVNPVTEWGLDAAHSLYLKGPTVPETLRTVADPARVRAIVAALDTPLPVVATPPVPRTQQDYADIVIVGFTLAGGKNHPLEYNRQTGTLTNRPNSASRDTVTVSAPPDFAQTLGLP